MTHLKKSLAMFLALIMMFSSMSVAANAWTSSDDPSDITFTVKFFRESPINSGNWIETEKAAPGENLKLRVYVKTGFYTSGGESCIVFDKDFFSAVGFQNEVNKILTVNTQYAGPAGDPYEAGEYLLEASAGWKDEETFPDWSWKYDMDYILNEIENDPDFFKTHELISNNILVGSSVVNTKFTDDTWMYEFDMVVNDNTTTNTIDKTGEAEVPPYYNSIERDGDFFVDFMKGMEGAYRSDRINNKSMFLWVPEFYTNPDTITTTSEIVFDMGLVDENGDWYEDTYTTEKGIISKEADLEAIANPEHPEGLVFAYWSTQKPGEGVEQEKVSTISYDYDAQTLYAVWSDIPEVSYTLKEFYMNADGSYPKNVEGTKKEAAPNSKVSAPASTDALYTLDETLSDFDVVINSDGSSVVNAYYERNKYNLVYHYEDMAGDQTDSYSVRFGDVLPGFGATGSSEPSKTGYTFVGWTTVEDGTTAETLPSVMPSEDLHLYPVYEPGETYDFEYIFNAGEGEFADGEKVKRYSYKYLEKTITPEEPTAPGKVFVAWDDEIPELAADDRTFNAIYEDEIYTITFMADTDGDGEYETEVSSEDAVYGEQLTPEFAPENYPVDAWKLADGTAVEFSDEETAYTVTGNVTFYTVGKDEYPANFYWSEEDLNNGAEPYKTIYVKYGTLIPDPTDPEKAGYNFIQWELDLEGQYMDTTDGKDFFAIFEAKDITVTFDPNEGECDVTSATVKYEESIEKLPEASRDGYEFLGWLNPEGENVGTAGDEYKVPADNVTLTADWKAEKHTITFVDTDGTELGKIEADTDAEISTPSNLNPPVKEGHEFTGWTTEGTEGTVAVPSTMPAEDMILTATWKKLSYALNADANGGEFDDGTDKISTEILYGEPLEVEQPDLEGHKFLGWANADDASNKIITLPETMPDEAINIKAVWDTNKHIVTYDAMGGIFTEEAVPGSSVVFTNVEYGADIPVPSTNPTKEGYTFVRWTPEAPEAMPDEDITFRAEWEEIPEPEEQTYEIYVKYPNPANPEEMLDKLVITGSALPGTTVEVIKEGETSGSDKTHTYDEILANVDVNGIEPDYDNKPSPITVAEGENKIYVDFKLINYTVEFDPNGGKFGESEDSVVLNGTYGQAVNAPANPSKEGYNFTGWDKTVPETFTEDVVITATWEIQKHNAIFVVVDENGNEVDRIPVEYEYGKTITAPEYTPDSGYEFNGWDIPAGTTMGEEDVTFTAALEPIIYKLSYSISGLPADKGVEAPLTQSGLRYNEEVTVSAATEVPGYTFDGWYNDRDKYDFDGNDKITILEDVVLTGTYTAKEYLITFDSNGAAYVAPEKHKCDETVATLPAVTRDGYTFDGWFDGETKVEPGFKMPANDIALTAKWTKIIVYSTITLDANGGKFSNGAPVYPVTAEVGVPFNAVPANPTRDGFEFIGWVDENGNATSIPATFPEKDVTIKATWAELYDVTYYDTDETTVFKSYVDAAKEGAAIPAPTEIPVNEGYKFTGWVDAEGNKVTAMPAGNLELYPSWEKIIVPEYTIIYMNGSELVHTVSYKENDPIADYKLDDIEGMTFKGWTPELPSTMPAKNLVVSAVWEANEYTITFDSNGGSDVPAATYKFGATVVAPEDPTREGFKFIEWTPALPSTMPAENLTVVAKWEAVVVTKTLTVDANGGEFADGTSTKTETLAVGETIGELPVPTRDGYDFAGWEGIPEDGKMPETDLTIKATWTPVVVPSHTVEYYYAVGGELYDTLTFKEGEAIVHPEAPVVEGLTFKGWTDEDGNALPTVMGSEDIKAYAQFDLNTYKVTYMVDGEVYKEYDVLYQAEVPVPTDPADSETRTFAGWSPAPEAVMPAHDLTYTATWVNVPSEGEYSVTYLYHNGETYSKYVLSEGDEIPVPAGPQRFGYVFVGWEPEVPETMPAEDLVFEPKYEVDKTFVTIVVGGTVIAGGVIAASITNAAIITGVSIVGGILVIVGVAELIKHTHTVTYIVDGEVYKTYKVVEGTKIPVPADPAKDGFTFEGWNPEVPEKMGKEDLVFEATWGVKAADDSEVDVEIPETGSVAGGLTAFAIISGAAAAAYVITKKKKED